MHAMWWRALSGSATVVELGCGFGVVLKQLTERGFQAHGVDIFQPYLDYVPVVAPLATCECSDALEWCEGQEDGSWDAVMMVDSIEHVPHDVGERLLEHAQRIARRAVVLETPSGFVEQDAREAFHTGTAGVPDVLNPYQAHACGWERSEFEALGFLCVVKRSNRGHDRIYAAWNR